MRHASRMHVTRAPLIVSCDLRISAVIVTLWRAWMVPCGSMTTASACVPPRSTPMASVSERARFMVTGLRGGAVVARNQGAASEMVRGDRIAKNPSRLKKAWSPTQTGPAKPQHDTHARGALLGRNAEPLPSLIRQTFCRRSARQTVCSTIHATAAPMPSRDRGGSSGAVCTHHNIIEPRACKNHATEPLALDPRRTLRPSMT